MEGSVIGQVSQSIGDGAKLRVVVVPIGNVPREKVAKYMELIRAHSVLELSLLTRRHSEKGGKHH